MPCHCLHHQTTVSTLPPWLTLQAFYRSCTTSVVVCPKDGGIVMYVWALALQEYDFSIKKETKYQSGSTVEMCAPNSYNYPKPTVQQLYEAQQKDEYLQQTYKSLITSQTRLKGHQ